MYLSVTFVLLIAGTSLVQVNGNWLRERKRSLPNEVTLNGVVKKCGIELQEAEKCSCRALICDGQQACEHATGIMGGFRRNVKWFRFTDSIILSTEKERVRHEHESYTQCTDPHWPPLGVYRETALYAVAQSASCNMALKLNLSYVYQETR
ncbi:Hypothetical predicted protein [Paramuricea clavata]|uniref:Uncharacterized protein n=1 Tax=Paramuricea clavata TaxID=317549 RepID=A0A7D9D7P1_PARCT|nr:Hypothetical predicted protein [Paramuricea clavata]